jgi:hypothetical protein
MVLRHTVPQLASLPLMPMSSITIAGTAILRRTPTPPLALTTPRRARTSQSPFLLKLAPPLHRDFTRIELAIASVAGLIAALHFAGGLARVAPGEVVKVPESVCGQDEIPDGQGDEVDAHPEHVDGTVGRDDDEDTRETEDEGQEDERDDRRGGVGYGCDDCFYDCGRALLAGRSPRKVAHDYELTQINRKSDRRRQHQCADQLDEDDELHGKAESAAKISNED